MMEKVSLWDKIENIFNVLNHVMIGFVSIYMIWLCYNNGYSQLTLHVLLCTLGYQLLMAEALMCLAPGNVWTYLFTRKTKIIIHWMLQIVGASISIAGIIIEYNNRRVHFRGTHSLTGLISAIFLVISLINGLSNLYSKELSRFIRPVYQKLCHNIMGTTTFVVGMVSLIHGYDLRWFTRSTTEEIQLLLKLFGIFTIVLSLYGAFQTAFNQVKGVLIRTSK